MQTIRESLRFFIDHCLNEKQRRTFAGLLSLLLPSPARITSIQWLTGLSVKTIRRGRDQLLQKQDNLVLSKAIRQPGAGRQSKVSNHETQQAVLQVIEPETAGDPITGLKWTRKTLRRIAKAKTVQAAPTTVSKILRLLGYSPRVNSKSKSGKANHPDRDQQFRFIKQQRSKFIEKGIAVISVDCKKKELIGQYKNNGKAWVKQPYETFDHDFPDLAEGVLVPFGIYDIAKNSGYVFCGTNRSTTEFAVDAIAAWWQNAGSRTYRGIRQIYLLVDAGPPNSYRSKLWKWYVQTRLADKFGLTIHISHYPPGTSKYNPIEHRLFPHISSNWSGIPLVSYETGIKYIQTTTTETGLKVDALLLHRHRSYETGQKVSEKQYTTINLTSEKICPDWNYTIRPRNVETTQSRQIKYEEKLIDKAVWHFENQKFSSKKLAQSKVEDFLAGMNWEFHEVKFLKFNYHKKKQSSERGRPPKGSKMKRLYSAKFEYQLQEMYQKQIRKNSSN